MSNQISIYLEFKSKNPHFQDGFYGTLKIKTRRFCFGGLIMSKKQYRALKDALVSARMEGYTTSAHTEKDCARLLSGEATAEEIVRETLARL